MQEMTLSGLIRLSESQHAKESNWLVIEVQNGDSEPEVIINPKSNFDEKIHYYSQAYNEDLTLKANPSIKIVHFDFFEDVKTYFWTV